MCILQHFNFTVQQKYYVLRHFHFAVWPKYRNLRYFSIAVVLKVEFLCVRVSNISIISGKAWNRNGSLNTFLSFFTHHWFTRVLKTPEIFFLVQRYRYLHHLSLELDFQIPRLGDLPPACQGALHNKIVIDTAWKVSYFPVFGLNTKI